MAKHIHIHFHDGDFKESEHPRATNGQFGSGGAAKTEVAQQKAHGIATGAIAKGNIPKPKGMSNTAHKLASETLVSYYKNPNSQVKYREVLNGLAEGADGDKKEAAKYALELIEGGKNQKKVI